MLEEIANAVDGSMKIFVDGGIRSGVKELQVQLLQQTKAQQAQEQQEVNLPELLLQAVMQKLVTRQVSGDGLVLQ